MMLNNSGVMDGVHEAVGNQRGGHNKRPWTAEEDAFLMEYVQRYGAKNWKAVQGITGLARCGKSCRERYANQLIPDRKKGSLSPEEGTRVIELQSRIGNKWASIAAQLPGRTGNDIKNYWKTKAKRHQEEAAAFHQHQHQHQHQGLGPNPELTSNQTPLCINGGDEGQMGGSAYTANEDHYETAPVPSQVYSGLLNDVLVEAQYRSNKKAKSGDSYSPGWPGKEKGLMVEEEDPLSEMDDELLSLLDSPSKMPAMSEWYM